MEILSDFEKWVKYYSRVKNAIQAEAKGRSSPSLPKNPLATEYSVSFPLFLNDTYGVMAFFTETATRRLHPDGRFSMQLLGSSCFNNICTDLPLLIQRCVEDLLRKCYPVSEKFLSFDVPPEITSGIREVDSNKAFGEIMDSFYNLALFAHIFLGPVLHLLKGPIALTGTLKEENGRFQVGHIDGLRQKLFAVAVYGIKQFFIPRENEEEVAEYRKEDGTFSLRTAQNHELEIIPVQSPEEVLVSLFGKEWHREEAFRKVFDLKYLFQQEMLDSNYVKIRNILGVDDEKYADISKYVKVQIFKPTREKGPQGSPDLPPGSPDAKYRDREESEKKEPPILPSELIRKFGGGEKRVTIFGEAGSGKSTILRALLKQLCKEEIESGRKLTPIFIELGSIEDNNSRDFPGLLIDTLITGMAIETAGGRQDFVHRGIYRKYLRALHDHGKVLFLLDAYDEMMHKKDFSPASLKNAVITSRHHGGIAGISEEYEVCPLEEESIKKFGENYLADNGDKEQEKQGRQSEFIRFVESNKQSGMKHLLSNPLMLSLVVFILKKSAPGFTLTETTKSHLISEAIRHLAERMGQQYVKKWCGKDREPLALIHELMGKIAYESFFKTAISEDRVKDNVMDFLLPEKTNELGPRELEKKVEEAANHFTTGSGILESFREGEYRFFHQVFHEFFVAKYVVDRISDDADQFRKWINEHKFDLRYEMVMRFVAGLLDMQCAKN